MDGENEQTTSLQVNTFDMFLNVQTKMINNGFSVEKTEYHISMIHFQPVSVLFFSFLIPIPLVTFESHSHPFPYILGIQVFLFFFVHEIRSDTSKEKNIQIA